MRLTLRTSLLAFSFPVLGAAAALFLQGALAQEKPRAAQPAGAAPAIGAAPKGGIERTAELQKFMRKKLDASNKILEGLTTENSGLVKEGADDLATMCDAEQWRISKDVMYRQFSEDFQRATRSLGESAKASDLDKALIRWMDVTMQCIDCHRFVRDKLIAGQPATDGKTGRP